MIGRIGRIFECPDGWLDGLDGYLSARTDGLDGCLSAQLSARTDSWTDNYVIMALPFLVIYVKKIPFFFFSGALIRRLIKRPDGSDG